MRFSLIAPLCLSAALAFSGCGAEDGISEENYSQIAQALGAGQDHVQDEILVKFVAGAGESEKAEARGKAGLARKELIRGGSDGELELAQVPSGRGVSDAIERVRGHWAVEFAEPNWVYTHNAVPNDTSFGSLWGLHNTGQTVNGGAAGTADVDLDMPEAWDIATGSSAVYVGVIDEGADHRHPDLAGVIINPGEDANGDGVITAADMNGVDDDGNGKIDDVRGWDFVGNNNSTYDGKGPRDTTTDAHGTHVSGTIGGVGNNGTGVVGVNWNVRVISGKFLGKSGGTTANAIKALDYFADLKTNRGVNVIATNNSWGGGGFSQALQDAIERSNAAGILFIAAAGNGGSDGVGDNNDVTASYPSNYPNTNVIAVAAIDRWGNLTSFSNYGATKVDVAAPGAAILSTTPNNTYKFYNGTSMATPHVTGLAALLAAYDPALNAASLKARILDNVVATPSLAGKCVTGGRINAYRALSLSGIDP